MEKKESDNLSARRLNYYLQEYWVQPPKDPLIRKSAESFVKSKQANWSVLIENSLISKQVAQQVILAYGRQIYWETVNCYSLVEKFIQGEPVITQCAEPELLIITITGKEPPNRQKMNITNGVIAHRASLPGKKTLIISSKRDPELEVQPVLLGGTKQTVRKDII